jgi:hypothetical protein
MTEDETIENCEDRKAALRRRIASFGPDAPDVYAADKVTKVRCLHSRATRAEHVLDADNASGQAKREPTEAACRCASRSRRSIRWPVS